jgi:WD40 repeat protein
VRDLALLKLLAPFTGIRTGWGLYPGAHVPKAPATVFAFPRGQIAGVRSDIIFKGTLADSWWQADNTADAQYKIQPGFSGSPVFEPTIQRVLGIIAEADPGDPRVGFLIPGSALLAFLAETAGPDFADRFRAPAPLHGVPELPKKLVQRAVVIRSIAEMLLGDSPIVGLRGMGGIGKTVVARLLAEDPAIRHRYHDGIFWRALSQNLKEEELKDEQRGLLDVLGGRQSGAASIDELRDAITKELDGREVLIIVDDVWTANDVHAFNVRADGCSVLFTSRRSSGFDLNNVPVKNIELLDWPEAEELFRAYADIADNVALDEVAGRILGHCNRHALGVVVAGSMVRQYPTRTALILDRFEKADVSRIVAAIPQFRRSSAYPSQETSLFRVLQTSFELLHERERKFVAHFAIFPEDTQIPIAAVELLGSIDNLDELEIARSVGHLDDAALLTFHWSTEPSSSYVTFHDLQRDFVVCQSDSNDRLESHSALVQVFRDRYGKLYAEGPNNGPSYLRRFMVYHLLGAKMTTEVFTLLIDPDWITHRLVAKDPVREIVRDYDLALAHKDGTDTQRKIAIEIRDILHRQSDIFDDYPNFVRETLMARMNIGTSCDVDEYVNRLEAELFSRSALRPTPGVLRRDKAALKILRGHSRWLSHVVILDRERALSASDDHTLRLWNLTTGDTLRVLQGHSGAVAHIAVLDGEHALSASDDHTIRLWDLTTGNTLRVLRGHTERVTHVVTLDQVRALSASHDGTLRLWDLTNGDALRILRAHSKSVTHVVVLDTDRALSASHDGTLRLWDLTTGDSLRVMLGHSNSVSHVVALDHARALSVSADHTLRVWDLTTGQTIHVLRGHSKSVTHAVVLDPGHAISASGDKTLRLWDLTTGDTLRVLRGHSNLVSHIVTLGHDRALSASHDGTLRLWDLTNGDTLRILQRHSNWVTYVAALDSDLALSASHDCTLRLWDLTIGGTRRLLQGHSNRVSHVVALERGKALSASHDHTLRLWDFETGNTLRVLRGHSRAVTHILALNPECALSASHDGTLRLWDLMTGDTLRTLEGHSERVTHVIAIDREHALSTSHDSTLRLWNLTTGDTLRVLQGHSAAVTQVVAVDPERALSASHDGTLRLWDLTTGRTLYVLHGHSERVTHVVAIDRKRALSASHDGILRLWDLTTRDTMRVLHGHLGAIAHIVAVDHERALSASWDNTLRLWDLTTGNTQRVMQGHSNLVSHFVVLGHQRVLSASWDNTLRLWDLTDGRVVSAIATDDPITAVAIAPTSHRGIAGLKSGRVIFFNYN